MMPIFCLFFLALFWSSISLSGLLLHYVDQLNTDVVCLLFGADQVPYSLSILQYFFKNICLLQLETMLMSYHLEDQKN